MKATVDPDLCVGCELCVQLCPDVFAMQGDVATAGVDTIEVIVNDERAKSAVPGKPMVFVE